MKNDNFTYFCKIYAISKINLLIDVILLSYLPNIGFIEFNYFQIFICIIL